MELSLYALVILTIGLKLLESLHPCHGAPTDKEHTIIEGEYCVVVREPEDVARIASFVHDRDVVVKQRMGTKTFLHLRTNFSTAQLLDNQNGIEIIEPNVRISLSRPVVKATKIWQNASQPNTVTIARKGRCQEDPITVDDWTWNLVRTSHSAIPDYYNDSYRYVYDYDGKGVDIYIIDSGIDIQHTDFNGRARHGFLASDLENEGYLDVDGHGTHVASIAGGTLFGMAKAANLIAVKVLGSDGEGSYATVMEGINYVTDTVRRSKQQGQNPRAVINLSLGGSVYSQIFYNTIQDAVGEGIAVMAAAGNDAVDAGEQYPSSFDNVITVGATDKHDNMANFSNYGSSVDILAPGDRVYAAYSTYNDACAIVTPFECGATASGTSQASPHVAGMVARFLEALDLEELAMIHQSSVKDMLLQTASRGYVRFRTSSQSGTPNRLLYKDCGKVDYVVTTPCWGCNDGRASAAYTPGTLCSGLLFWAVASWGVDTA